MNGKVNFETAFSKISTDVKDIEKSFAKVNLATFSKTVEFERHPSNGSIRSLPQNLTYKNSCRSDIDNFKFTKSNKSEFFHSLNGIVINTESDLLETAINHNVLQDPKKDGDLVTTINVTEESLNSIDTSAHYSTISYFYNKVKSKIASSTRKKRVKEIKEKKINKKEIINKMEDLFIISTEVEKELGRCDDHQLQICNPGITPCKFLHRGITILSNKVYYYNDGVYLDDELNEFQMSCSKNTNSIERSRQSEIEKVIAPETGYVPIRKDSITHIEGLSALQELAGGIKRLPKRKDTTTHTDSTDFGSSSLNLSSTANGTTQPDVGSSCNVSSNGQSNNFSREFEYDVHNEAVDHDNVNNGDARGSDEPTQTMTNASTIRVPHTNALGIKTTKPHTVTSSSTNSFSSSSSSCSIIHLPEHPNH